MAHCAQPPYDGAFHQASDLDIRAWARPDEATNAEGVPEKDAPALGPAKT